MNSTSAVTSRESAREPSGRFGVQAMPESLDVDLVEVPRLEPTMDLDEATEWWFEDGSFEITCAAAGQLDVDGWEKNTLGPNASAIALERAADAERAAAAMLGACAPFDHQVRHGTGARHHGSVGDHITFPLAATTPDGDTAAYFAESRSEDGIGFVYTFTDGANGVQVNASEWVVTGTYRVTDERTEDDVTYVDLQRH